MRSLDEALAEYAKYVERATASNGWDQPATLWEVEFCEHSDSIDIAADRGEVVIPLSLSLRLVAELEGHPAEALVGERVGDDALAAVLVTEGWTYHPDRVAYGHLGGNVPELAPSEYDDSVEVRFVHLVARDGTEVAYQRGRDDCVPEVMHVGPVDGRVAEAMRRVVGRPARSGGAVDSPTVAHTRNRVMLSLITDVIALVVPLGVSAVAWALDNLERERDALYMSCALRFGLFEDDWEQAIEAARREIRRRDAKGGGVMTPYDDPQLDRLAEWGDGSMWADAAAARFRPRAEAILYLEQLRMDGALRGEDLQRIVELAERAPKEWDEPF